MIELKTFDKSRVNPVDDGVLYNALAGESGILTGCGLTAVGGAQVQIRDGYLILCGRVCKVSQEVLHANLSANGTQEGQLVAAINLSNVENPIKLETRLPKGELMQGDINAGGTVYELEIATYTADELSVKSITTTANKIGLANKADLEAVSAELANKANIAALGQPSGIATLDGNGKLAQMPTAADVGAVPTSRTVNGKSLNGNISLTAANVGAIPLIEESTWTPNVLEMRGLSGGCTYTSREGHFIRIGKMVLATFDIVVAKKPTTANWTNYTQVCVNWLPGNYVRTDRAYNMGARVTLKSGTDPIVASTQFAYNTVAFTVADGPLLTNMLGDGFVLNGSIAYIVNV